MCNAASRVAFAAYLHDLGKFAERARIKVDTGILETHEQLYCPQAWRDGKPIERRTHKHAAYTALAWDMIETDVPDLVRGDMYPFASRSAGEDITDSLLNASAMHHRPQTFLQWIIATADRVASGFERQAFDDYNHAEEESSNHYQARLLTLFEQIRLQKNDAKTESGLHYRYPLAPLSARSIFPLKREEAEPRDKTAAQQEYEKHWQHFLQDMKKTPASHRHNWNLWLDHFDTLWQHYTQAIPSATFKVKAEVSLYDHSKTTAALATALWLWHEAEGKTGEAAIAALKDRSDYEEKKILLIQGDFFGIQNFIFASGSQTNRHGAKILRGRSFQVSLFAELAALKILQACELPPTSQITNAAGKFMIVAPNTPQVIEAVKQAREEINQWFLQHTFGQVALGVATQAASCNEFVDKERFAELVKQSFAVLEAAKLQRFALTENAPTVFNEPYPAGACPYDHHLPARGSKTDPQPAALSADQILLGSELTRKDRIMVLKSDSDLHGGGNTKKLQQSIFGFHIAFTGEEDDTGKFGELARQGNLLRCWDFSLPTLDEEKTLWQGYARRYINAYVPRFGEYWEEDKYLPEKDEQIEPEQIKTFSHLACEERRKEKEGNRYLGNIAIATLKGDVDNLGSIFQKGLAEPTFAKMAALSRQMNHFFSLWLPAYCAEHYPDTYTVFAGGDDFFLIGPWLKTQALAADMRAHFTRYVAENEAITFSAGISISKPGLPLPRLSAYAEEALEKAKAHGGKGEKNALCLYGETLSWHDWEKVQSASSRIEGVKQSYGLSTGYLYDMLHYVDLAQREKGGDIQASMWRSRLYYRTRRYVNDRKKMDPERSESIYQELITTFEQQGISALGTTFRIPLFNHFYQLRAR